MPRHFWRGVRHLLGGGETAFLSFLGQILAGCGYSLIGCGLNPRLCYVEILEKYCFTIVYVLCHKN